MTERVLNTHAGKTVLITGGSRGVGFATASAFLRRGANVVITARGNDRLQRSLAELRAIRSTVSAVAGDVGVYEDALGMVDTAVRDFGGLDIVVNNAGLSMRGNFADLSPQTCHSVLSSSLLGGIYVSRAAVEHVRAARGSIVFVSSIAGIFGMPGASIYCAAKGGMNGLAESLRLELSGVHIGVAHLGFTEHDPEKRILAADGSGVLPDRPAHHTQARAAELIVEMIDKRKNRVVFTPVGKIGAAAYRLSPAMVMWSIRKAQRSQWKVMKDFS
ncbi:MAG: SDR family NAD(P)-dependent oxidoreductase [Actinomycetota bacterium]